MPLSVADDEDDDTLWDLDPHTAAKHRLLRAYVDAWFPIMAYQTLKVRAGDDPRLLIVDGFAGPGRYKTGEDGSPLILLKALLDHASFGDWDDMKFIFLFIEHDQERVDHLEGEVENLDLPDNVFVEIQQGEFRDRFGELVEQTHETNMHLVPTFAFIDPFGYTQAPVSFVGRFFEFPRCEALIFLPLDAINRFLGWDKMKPTLNELFGDDRWKEALEFEGIERREKLLSLFEESIEEQGEIEFVRSFAVKTLEGRDYRLVFATGSKVGLSRFKDAMWSVDPVAGTRFVATTKDGQELLFGASAELDTKPLLDQLRTRFGTDWFTVEDAEDCCLLDTPYKKGHLRQKTLAPARKRGELEVHPDSAKGFNTVDRMRFTS